ncbi:MAG: TIR domain-containing protein [Patescibacteria group bacterium]|nr:TIR domain-containing protein [Patescibacteria group bacterium]
MTRNVFLSFENEDLDLVNLFRGQAKNPSNPLEFSDYSVKVPFDSTNADYVKRAIKDLINKASVTLCLIGYRTRSSRWVDWELSTSRQLGKGLVGVKLHSSSLDLTPDQLTYANAEIVNWDIQKIVNAIERAAQRSGY